MALDAKHVFTTVMVCATALACAHLVANAGSLTPPGAPGSTMKTLNEVEARIPIGPTTTPGDADSIYKITQSGSYYLTGHLTGASGKHGIEIATGDVTLDLNGYGMSGGGSGRLNAIEVSALFGVNIEMQNGKIDSWQLGGVHAPNAIGIRVSNVDVFVTLGEAAFVVGPSATITDCTASFTSGGFVVGANSVIDRCVAEGTSNDASAFVLGEGAVVSRSVASNGTGSGFVALDGSQPASGRVFDSCSASGNAGTGFVVGWSATVQDCSSSDNSIGFDGENGSVFRGCVATDNTGDGFNGDTLTIESCSANDNGGFGFDLGFESFISRSSAHSNGAYGIDAKHWSVIRECVANFNGFDGIRVTLSCLVIGNMASQNGQNSPSGAGIHATNGSNQIEGNTVANNDVGFDIDGSANVLIRNAAHFNGNNFGQVNIGNHVGTLVTNAAAINAATNSNVNINLGS